MDSAKRKVQTYGCDKWIIFGGRRPVWQGVGPVRTMKNLKPCLKHNSRTDWSSMALNFVSSMTATSPCPVSRDSANETRHPSCVIYIKEKVLWMESFRFASAGRIPVGTSFTSGYPFKSIKHARSELLPVMEGGTDDSNFSTR